jgi:hypothetical protein
MDDSDTKLDEIRKMMSELEKSSDMSGFMLTSDDENHSISDNEIEDSEDDEDEEFEYNVLVNKIVKDKEKIEMINLMINYFIHPNEKRQKEFNYCIVKNMLNPYINKIHVFYNKTITLPKIFKIGSTLSHKFVFVEQDEDWITYETMITYAEEKLQNKIVAITNLDIFLDKNDIWEELISVFENNDKKVYSLSRYEFDQKDNRKWKDQGFEQLLFGHTQDTWIFRGGIKVPDTDFELGTFGCDIAFNERLKKAGYQPINMGTHFKTYHFDRERDVSSKNNNILIKKEIMNDTRIMGTFPEQHGQLILPDYNLIENTSLDTLVRQLNIFGYDLYMLKCELLSKHIKIDYSKTCKESPKKEVEPPKKKEELFEE